MNGDPNLSPTVWLIIGILMRVQDQKFLMKKYLMWFKNNPEWIINGYNLFDDIAPKLESVLSPITLGKGQITMKVDAGENGLECKKPVKSPIGSIILLVLSSIQTNLWEGMQT